MSQTYISVMQGSGGVASEGPRVLHKNRLVLFPFWSQVAVPWPLATQVCSTLEPGSASVSLLILVQPTTHHPPLDINAAGWNPIPFTFLYLGKLVILQLCIRAKASSFVFFSLKSSFMFVHA